MKKIITTLLLSAFILTQGSAIASMPLAKFSQDAVKNLKYSPKASNISYAFIFDGPSEKNNEVLAQFQRAITITTAPDFKPVFDKNHVYVGDWSEKSVNALCEKALNSSAQVVVSLGYLSTKYYNSQKDRRKTVITIDQYGLKDIGSGVFNPVQQNVKSVKFFKNLINFQKGAILVNESFYKTRNDWAEVAKKAAPDINVDVISVSKANHVNVTNNILSKGYDAVIFTPLYNLSNEERKAMISSFNNAKLPTFSTQGKDDVELGVLLGSSALDIDRKLAEATSFDIRAALKGHTHEIKPVKFYEDQIVYINKDTCGIIGYVPHLRVLNFAEIITEKAPAKLTLSAIFDEMSKTNLDIKRKHLLVKAARRSSLAAVLKYLPTFSMTVGFQQYNEDYADSAKLSIPEKTGVFKMGLDQVIYSPALVTNILIKNKQVDFTKEEAFLKEQEVGLELAFLYIETLMLENMIKVQKEYVNESRENLAIARVREQMGKCGPEEALRWAAQLSKNEQNLLDMNAAHRNLKIDINKLLHKDQKFDFTLEPLKTTDPAFYTSEIHLVDYVTYPDNLEKFTQMLIEEAYRVSPELAKLRAAIKMKTYERNMYLQKFVLPDAVVSLEYTSLFDREFANPIPALPIQTALGPIPLNRILNTPDATNFRLGIFAQWKPIEGGQKFAEIARIKAEREELMLYDAEVRTMLEQHIRNVINNALAAYMSIGKNYKASFAAGENYVRVKNLYRRGDATIAQLVDAQNIYLESKVKAYNSQYAFFKELVWVQRGICAVDWNKANDEAKAFIQRIKDEITPHPDIELL